MPSIRGSSSTTHRSMWRGMSISNRLADSASATTSTAARTTGSGSMCSHRNTRRSKMPATSALREQIVRLFADALQLEVPSVDTDLFETGILDSLAFVELLLQ